MNLDLDWWSKVSQGDVQKPGTRAPLQVGTLRMFMELKDMVSANIYKYIYGMCRISFTSSLKQGFHNIYLPIQPYLQYPLTAPSFSPLQSLTCLHTTSYPIIHSLTTTNPVHSSSKQSKNPLTLMM